MIKTFINGDEVIISEEALKTRYPEYIAYIDCKACHKDGIILRALQEMELIDAIRKITAIANKNINKVYLCGIFQKTDKLTHLNEPLYEIIVGARMGKHKLNDWHLWNEENGETTFPLATWYSDDFMWELNDFEEVSKGNYTDTLQGIDISLTITDEIEQLLRSNYQVFEFSGEFTDVYYKNGIKFKTEADNIKIFNAVADIIRENIKKFYYTKEN